MEKANRKSRIYRSIDSSEYSIWKSIKDIGKDTRLSKARIKQLRREARDLVKPYLADNRIKLAK